MGLEVELEVLKTVVSKLDASLEKISEVSNSIGRLLAVHDERIDQLEKSSDKRTDEIKELNDRITIQTKEILEKISSLEKNMEDRMRSAAESSKQQHQDIQKQIQADIVKLEDRVGLVEKWKWYVMGAMSIAGFLLGHFTDWFKMLK